MKAMVLAAGVGSRLEPLTSQLPKPLVPVANTPVMEHILALLKKHGITEVISNLHYLPEKIQAHFGDGRDFGMHLQFKLEKELSGDAGGVRACKDFFGGETFIVLMGDLLTDANLTRIIDEHKKKKALATIAIKEVDDVSQFGVAVTNDAGFITGFQEKPKPEEALSKYASTGIYVLEPEIFDHIPGEGVYGFGRQLFPTLVENGLPVLGSKIDDCYWSDVGTINQYRLSNFDAVHGLVKVSLPPHSMPRLILDAGASLADDVDVQGHLLLGRNSKVAAGATIRGTVVVGHNCTIGEGAHLQDTVIWNDSKVGARAQLTNCAVGNQCVVADDSRHNEVASVRWTQQVRL
jgi:mannose-1-phosphate guanylyltransferase